MSKHTHGPWDVHEWALGWSISARNAHYTVCQLYDCINAEANARLIATAPDLLTSIKELLEICRWKCSPNDEVLLANGKSNEHAMINAIAAINRAEGKEQDQ
jgi:hypothetical protein